MNTRCISDMLLRPANLQRTLQSCTSANPMWRRATPGSTILQRSLTTTSKLQFAQTQQWKDDRPKNPSDSSSAKQLADIIPTSKIDNPSTSEEAGELIDQLFNKSMGLRNRQKDTIQANSADEFNNSYAKQTFADWSRPSGTGRQGIAFDNLEMPEGLTNTAVMPPLQEVEVKYPRLNPSYGRTVVLDNKKGRDIMRGLMMLNSMLGRNKVRSNMHSQKFHERPGLKRKRLKSERWRRRFTVAFQATCTRVTELKKKGW